MTASTATGTTALLLLDLQNEMVHPEGKVGGHGLAGAVAARGVLARAAEALGAFRKADLPVVHVHLAFRPDYADCLSRAARIVKLKQSGACIAGSWGTEFADEVKPLPGEMVFAKSAVNAFFNTGLLSWLQSRRIETLAIGGVATNLAVESAARYADDAGFSVIVLEDLCAAPNPEWHAFSAEKFMPALGTVTRSSDFLRSLEG